MKRKIDNELRTKRKNKRKKIISKLMEYCERDDVESIKKEISKLTSMAHIEYFPLMKRACKMDKINVLKYMLEKFRIRINRDCGRFVKILMSIICEQDSFSCFQFMLNSGYDMTKKYQGETLLHAAVNGISLKIFHYLIEKGFYINSKDRIDSTPLHYAVKKICSLKGTVIWSYNVDRIQKCNRIILDLIANGANIYALNKRGMTPFSEYKDEFFFENIIKGGLKIYYKYNPKLFENLINEKKVDIEFIYQRNDGDNKRLKDLFKFL